MTFSELKAQIQSAQRTNEPADWMALELDAREHFQQVALMQAELAMFRYAAAMKEFRK